MLSSDVDEVFASQDISVIAAKLAGMKQSLVGGADMNCIITLGRIQVFLCYLSTESTP